LFFPTGKKKRPKDVKIVQGRGSVGTEKITAGYTAHLNIQRDFIVDSKIQKGGRPKVGHAGKAHEEKVVTIQQHGMEKGKDCIWPCWGLGDLLTLSLLLSSLPLFFFLSFSLSPLWPQGRSYPKISQNLDLGLSEGR